MGGSGERRFAGVPAETEPSGIGYVFRQVATVFLVVGLVIAPVADAQTQGWGVLEIDWVGIIDNGEGTAWPHGPYGSMYVEVERWLHGRLLGKYKLPLPGVHWTGEKFEWDDGDARNYVNPRPGRAFILNYWQHSEEVVRLRVYESDPGPFREHDVLMVVDVWRSQSTARAGWILQSARPANADAVNRAYQRGANSWAPSVWRGGVSYGMPSMFMQLTTR